MQVRGGCVNMLCRLLLAIPAELPCSSAAPCSCVLPLLCCCLHCTFAAAASAAVAAAGAALPLLKVSLLAQTDEHRP